MRFVRTALSLLLTLSLTLTALPFPAVALSASEDSLIAGPITETSMDGGQLVEPALDWDYTDDEPRPHVVVEATTPTVSTMATTDPPDVSLNYTQVAADKGYSFELTATTAQSGQSVTWASADPSVASVTPTGDTTALVTSLRAGETAITATLDNGDVAVCTVYATISDGVYYIGTGGLFLGLDGSLKEYMPMKMLAKQNAGPAKIRQLWKIHYYGSGSVSVRSMYKLDMGLYSSDDNVVSITTVGTGTEVPNANRWTIVQEDADYVFRHVGTVSKSMCVASGSFSPGARVITAVYSTTNSSFCWTLTQDTSIANQVLLINTQLGLPAQNAVCYVSPGETLTLADMDLTASFVSQYTNTQDLRWLAIDDSQEKIVRVNSSTGAVTGVAGGQTTITVKAIYNGVDYTKNYTVVVLPFPDGTYVFQNATYEGCIQIDDADAPEYDTSSATIEEWMFDGGAYQWWRITSLDNGYYKIVSEKSGMALSVNTSETSDYDVSLVQQIYSGYSRQQWKISKTESGCYKIKPRSSESMTDDMVMAVGYAPINVAEGINVEQRKYVDDNNYSDEWYIIPLRKAYSVGGEFYDGADVTYAYQSWIKCCYQSEYDISPTINSLSENKLNSSVVYFSSHGNQHLISLPNDVRLSDGRSESSGTTVNIRDYTLDVADLYIYDACLTASTADDSGTNLCAATHLAGAKCVIGWSESINTADSFDWQKRFQGKLCAGYTVRAAADYANGFDYLDDESIKSWRIYGDGNLTVSMNSFLLDTIAMDSDYLDAEIVSYDNLTIQLPVYQTETIKDVLRNNFDSYFDGACVITKTDTVDDGSNYVVDLRYLYEGFVTDSGYSVIVNEGRITQMRENNMEDTRLDNVDLLNTRDLPAVAVPSITQDIVDCAAQLAHEKCMQICESSSVVEQDGYKYYDVNEAVFFYRIKTIYKTPTGAYGAIITDYPLS